VCLASCGRPIQQKNLTRHFASGFHMNSPQLECRREGCNDKFWSVQQRIDHERIVHDGVEYKCLVDGCKSTPFASKYNLDKHTESVHEGVVYECAECSRTFSLKGWYEHVNSVHRGIKYKCEHCDKEYTQMHNLTKHIERAHTIYGDRKSLFTHSRTYSNF
jgi:uncharacterized Zn-finger protein